MGAILEAAHHTMINTRDLCEYFRYMAGSQMRVEHGKKGERIKKFGKK